MKIIHRDFKPENILIINKDEDDDDLLYIKICDFGSVKWFQEVINEKIFCLITLLYCT